MRKRFFRSEIKKPPLLSIVFFWLGSVGKKRIFDPIKPGYKGIKSVAGGPLSLSRFSCFRTLAVNKNKFENFRIIPSGSFVINSEAREWRHNSDKLRQTKRNGGRFEAFF